MKFRRKYYFLIAAILVTLLFAVWYVMRIHITDPVIVELTGYDDANNYKVTAKTILGKDIKISPDSLKTRYKLDFGYFNLISIESISSPNIPEINIRHLETKELLEFKSIKTENKLFITQVGNYSVFDVVKRIIEVNRFSLAIVIVILFLVIILHYYKLLKHNPRPLIYINWGLGVGLLLIMSALLFIAAYYTYPNAEDLSNSASADTFKSAVHLSISYLSLDTRYTSNLIYCFSPLAWGGVELHKLSVFLYIVLIITTTILLFRQITLKHIPFYQLAFAGLLFVLIHFAITPSIVADLYFISASSVYLLSWIALLLWFTSYLYWIKTPISKSKMLYGVLTITSFFFSFGLCEMNIVINAFVLLVLLYYHIKYKKSGRIELLILFIIFTVAISFIFIIPGAANRISGAGLILSGNAIVKSLEVSGIAITSTFFNWSLIKVIYIPVVVVFTLGLYPNFYKIKFPLNLKEIIVLFIASILILYLCYAVFLYFSTLFNTDVYVERGLNYINWGYQICILIFIPIAINMLIPRFLGKLYLHFGAIMLFSLLTIGISLKVSNNNLNQIYSEIKTNKYSQFKCKLQHRYDIIYEAKTKKGWKVAVVDTIGNIPQTIFSPSELGWDKFKVGRKIDYSHYYERYFNIDEIKINNDSITMVNKLLDYE